MIWQSCVALLTFSEPDSNLFRKNWRMCFESARNTKSSGNFYNIWIQLRHIPTCYWECGDSIYWYVCLQLNEAGEVTNQEIAKELCLPPVKLHCSSKPTQLLLTAKKVTILILYFTDLYNILLILPPPSKNPHRVDVLCSHHAVIH